MKRVRLIIAYDGTNYCGWQVQINGITVEEVLNKALKDLLNEEIAVIGASRTDSGVHAMGNVAVFVTKQGFLQKKYLLHLIKDCLTILESKNQMKSHLIGIHDTEIAQKHMNIRF